MMSGSLGWIRVNNNIPDGLWGISVNDNIPGGLKW